MALTPWVVLITSLLGSVHCAAMCGPLAAAAHGHWGSSMYHAGRLTIYLLAGVLAGALGAAFDKAGLWAGWPKAAAGLAGGLLVLFGVLGVLRYAGVPLPRLAGPFERLYRAGLIRLRALPPGWRGLGLGAASALLPCGWLYAYVTAAAGTGSIAGGAVAMSFFWLGTLPAVIAAASIMQQLTGMLRRRLPVFSALALIVIGLLTAFGRLTAHHEAELVSSPLMVHAGQHR